VLGTGAALLLDAEAGAAQDVDGVDLRLELGVLRLEVGDALGEALGCGRGVGGLVARGQAEELGRLLDDLRDEVDPQTVDRRLRGRRSRARSRPSE
jgi:hypothetical protein